MRPIAAAILLILLSGCGAWPDLGIPEEPVAGDGYPALVPIDALLAQAAVSEAAARATEMSNAALEARAARLRARAAVLSQPAEDRDALDRMRARLAALPG